MSTRNPLTDPTRRPDGYEPIICAGCGGFVSWCWPPAPPVPVTHAGCTPPATSSTPNVLVGPAPSR